MNIFYTLCMLGDEDFCFPYLNGASRITRELIRKNPKGFGLRR